MPITIQTDAQNESALAVLDKLLDAINGAMAGNETLIAWTNELCNSIEQYEEEHCELARTGGIP